MTLYVLFALSILALGFIIVDIVMKQRYDKERKEMRKHINRGEYF